MNPITRGIPSERNRDSEAKIQILLEQMQPNCKHILCCKIRTIDIVHAADMDLLDVNLDLF